MEGPQCEDTWFNPVTPQRFNVPQTVTIPRQIKSHESYIFEYIFQWSSTTQRVLGYLGSLLDHYNCLHFLAVVPVVPDLSDLLGCRSGNHRVSFLV